MDHEAERSGGVGCGSNYAGVTIGVEYVTLALLAAAPRQLRRRSLRSIKRLARSISDFGFLVPVLVDGQNRIIAGEGRVELLPVPWTPR